MGFGIFLSPLWDNNFYAGENTEVGKKPKLEKSLKKAKLINKSLNFKIVLFK